MQAQAQTHGDMASGWRAAKANVREVEFDAGSVYGVAEARIRNTIQSGLAPKVQNVTTLLVQGGLLFQQVYGGTFGDDKPLVDAADARSGL